MPSNSNSDTAMRDCTYGVMLSDTEVGCSNHEDLIHNGIVPLEVCNVCPYILKNVRQDFFAQTTALLIRKQRRGEIKAAQRSCGGCAETKRRHLQSESPVTQFIWPYWEGGSIGDEIRFSVRSVEHFFEGRAETLIIGDRPAWYTGPHIYKKRVKSRTPSRNFRDTISKLYWMATRPEVRTDFVWMMDDVYFVQPFSLADIQTPRAEPWGPSKSNKWQVLKTQSMELLMDRGLPTHDYATHLPHYVEKQKLHELFDRYDLHNITLIWELLYGNTYRENPQPVRPFLSRVGVPMEAEQLRQITKRATVFNHTSNAWCEGIRSHLQSLMPDRSSVENDSPMTHLVRRKPGRVVKRRPPETHRGYVKAER